MGGDGALTVGVGGGASSGCILTSMLLWRGAPVLNVTGLNQTWNLLLILEQKTKTAVTQMWVFLRVNAVLLPKAPTFSPVLSFPNVLEGKA